jgi:hypothetical protein
MAEVKQTRRALIRCDPLTGAIHCCSICCSPVELVRNDSENPEDWILSCNCRFKPRVQVPQWCKVDSWNLRNWKGRYNKNFRYLVVTES